MILQTIAESAKKRVQKEKDNIPEAAMRRLAEDRRLTDHNKGIFLFEEALKKKDINFICEVKKASPSQGIIAEHFPYLEIAKDYEKAGAACISVLTEPDFFKGNDQYLEEISKQVSIPTLRKDFTVDPYQIYQAKVLGASCVLLICSLLETSQISEYLNICDALGLSALVEAHDRKEIKQALEAKARIIGVNNRNLKTFEVDINNSKRLRRYIPRSVLFIAESGIKTAQDIQILREAKVNGVLMGEALMRSPNKIKMLQDLRG